MKKLVLALAAASALAATAAPAAAQSYGGDYGRYDDRYDRGARPDRPDRLEWRIDRAEQNGQIDRRYAGRLKQQVRVTENLAHRYRADGRYTPWERNDIQRRLASVAYSLDNASRNYGYGYGYDNYRR